jgi:hypothetical protein
VACAALLLLVAGVGPARAAAVVGGREGTWTIDELAGHRAPRQLALTGGGPAVRVPYVLPRGARQGPRLWYLLRLNATVRLGPKDGEYVLSAGNGQYTAAQILFTVRHGRVEADELGLVGGHSVATTRRRTLAVRFENYSQIRAIAPGAGELVFRLERRGGSPGTTATILGSSGIATTTVAPDELRLRVAPRAVVVNPGREVRIRFDLDRRGGRPDRPVRIVLSGGGTRRPGESSRVLAYAGVGSGRTGVFVLRAPARVGAYLLGIGVPDRYNQPSTAIRVDVVAVTGRRPDMRFVGGMSAALAAVGAGLYWRRRRPPAAGG